MSIHLSYCLIGGFMIIPILLSIYCAIKTKEGLVYKFGYGVIIPILLTLASVLCFYVN